ncbi:unnamed protein product [Durusdinium trenchii]|uniref:Phospholipid scramblase n=1 Tax=Durusdinium trenchii TaxID=1381693 RepID=A0ABP0K1Q4_9DINO
MALAGCCPPAATACCCLKTYDRDAAVQQILALTTDPDGPSLLGRLCWCQCQPIPRPTTGIEEVDEISNLAGVTLQYGNHVTAGSLESLRWATYDAATRTATATGFGGWYQPWYTGSWSEPAGDPIWCFLLWLARVGNATYEFQFSEDFQQAEIIPKGNLGVFCCCCCPCIPGWAPIPSCITRNYMVQADSSVKGDHWERFQGNCGRTPSLYYEIYTVYTIDGKETQWTKLAKEQTSAQVMMTI